MKLISWNVNGIRAALKKGLDVFFQEADADILCLQETKAREEQVTDLFFAAGYRAFWNSAEKPGYSGTAVFTRLPVVGVTHGIGHRDHDREGRVLNLEFRDFFVVNVYTPNSQRDLARLGYRTREWDPAFRNHLLQLEQRKPVIFCGDLNVAHQEIDLANPRQNVRNAGFTVEERNEFRRLLEVGYVDTFREFEKGPGHYSWWSLMAGARARNVGWRIDYVGISHRLRPALKEAFILPKVMGSDHCPVGAVLTE